MPKSSYIHYLIVALVFKSTDGRITTIPYPFYNREYSVPLTKNIETNSFNQHYAGKNNKWEMLFNGVYFYRTANRSYNQTEKNKPLATAIHGIDNFELSDCNKQSEQIIIHSNDHYSSLLKENEYLKYDAKVQPNYQFNEIGGLIAFDLIRKIDEEKSFLIQIRLPIISQEIIHKNPEKSISNFSTIIHDSRVYLDDQNKYFQARLDFLQEKGLITNERSPLLNLKGLYIQKEINEDYFANKLLEEESSNEYVFDEQEINFSDRYHFDSNDKKNLYASTKFTTYAEPTIQSKDFFNAIKNQQKTLSESEFNSILQGNYLGKNYHWNSFQKNHIAPLDMQLNFTKIIDTVIFQGLLSAVIPIQKKEHSDNYLDLSIFSYQPAIRAGTQINYAFKNKYCLIGYASFQYNFPSTQTIPAMFNNQSAYGFSPLYLKGKVSWIDLYGAIHLRIEASEKYGATIGYQYIYKSGDTIVPEVDHFYLLNGEKEELNYESWKKLTQSNVQLILLNGYFLYHALQFDIGLRTAFQGKNTPEIKEISLRCGLDF